MPFDAAGFPKEDGAYPAEPTPVERWLHYFVAVLLILARLRGLEGLSGLRSLSINGLAEKVFTTEAA
jgi:hypothetical protein